MISRSGQGHWARSVVAGLLAVALTSGGAPPAAAAPDENVKNVVDSFVSCAKREGDADVLLLLDQSASLSGSYQGSDGRTYPATDPSDLRVSASEEFVRTMEEFAADQNVAIQFSVAGFYGDYQPSAWRQLTRGSLQEGLSDVREVGSKDDGKETDYVNALDGARKDLGAQSSQCQMLVFFTDGEYDVDGSYGEKSYSQARDWARVEEEGKQLLCKTKEGPVATLRKRDVYFVSVGLTGGGNPEKLGFLRDITSGSNGCSVAPDPQRWAFIPAKDAGSLAFELSQFVGHSTSPEPPGPDGIADHQFGLDEIITSASVLADAGTDKMRIVLINPDGDTVASSEDSAPKKSGGVTVTATMISGQTARFLMKPDKPGKLAGTWTVRFVADNPDDLPDDVLTRTNIAVRSDLKAVWVNAAESLASGASSTIKAKVVSRRTGDEVDAEDIPGAGISVDYRDASGTVTRLATGKDETQWESGIPVTFTSGDGKPLPPGGGKFALTLDVEMTTPPKTRLLPEVASYELTLTAPVGLPEVDASPVVLKGTEAAVASDEEPSVGEVLVKGPGCVWVDAARTDLEVLPAGWDEQKTGLTVVNSSQETCLKVEDGQSASLPVEIRPATAGNGELKGRMVVKAAPLDLSQPPYDVAVPFVAEREKPLNRTVQWMVLVVALGVGLGIPVALLMVIRARSARIPVSNEIGHNLAYFSKDVAFDVDGSFDSLVIDSRQVRPATDGSVESVSEVDIEGVHFRARALGNPFKVADVAATVPTGGGALSDTSAQVSTDGTVRLPLALEGHWVAWPTRNAVVRVLYMFSTADMRSNDLSALSDRLNSGLEARGAQLAMLAPQAPDDPNGNADGDWGGSGSGGNGDGDWDDPYVAPFPRPGADSRPAPEWDTVVDDRTSGQAEPQTDSTESWDSGGWGESGKDW